MRVKLAFLRWEPTICFLSLFLFLSFCLSVEINIDIKVDINIDINIDVNIDINSDIKVDINSVLLYYTVLCMNLMNLRHFLLLLGHVVNESLRFVERFSTHKRTRSLFFKSRSEARRDSWSILVFTCIEVQYSIVMCYVSPINSNSYQYILHGLR